MVHRLRRARVMADPKPPQLPDGAPADLRAFIDCTAATVTLRNGKLDRLRTAMSLTTDLLSGWTEM
jgi:hypothetical protein